MTRPELHRLAQEILARLHAAPHMPTPAARALRREYSAHLSHATPRQVLTLALLLLKEATPLRRFMAYELIFYHHETLTSLHAKELERLGRGLDSWGAVDTFACYLSGPAWREKQVGDTLIAKWARAQNRWWRRAALVSTVPLNRKALGGNGDAARTLRICRMLRHDRDDMVVKALSWALRELAKREAKAVREFLLQYESELAPRVLREVRNKLTTGLKEP